MKKIAVIVALLTALAAVALLSSCKMEKAFYCEHCHQTKTDIPHYITVDTVDITVCSECYESYKMGKWSFPS